LPSLVGRKPESFRNCNLLLLCLIRLAVELVRAGAHLAVDHLCLC
jgi:hypothetical protein